MKKITVLLIALIAGAFAMQMNAAPGKAPMRSAIFSSLPSGFQQLGNTSIYYNVSERNAAGPGAQTGYSLLGKIGNYYYSSTYEANEEHLFWTENREGAGFIGAFQVNGGTATYLNAATGTTSNNVRMTSRIEPQGDVAARIVYTLTNNNDQAVTVNAGVWADIMIGDNDDAPLECLKSVVAGYTYGIKMKYSNAENAPLLCALFGEGVTGVTGADDYWFGFFSSNWHANEICGEYSSYIYNTNTNWGQSYAQYYCVENGNYDSGLGFCWKGREIPAHESIELSYVISVGEIDFEEPIIPDPEPGQDVFTYNVEVFEGTAHGYEWNALDETHKGHIWGYYEHPYGQEAYIEYQVDGDRGWTRIEDALISGEDYELFFDLDFDVDRTTNHVLQLRFTDGLSQLNELDGLSWIDVRSYEVTGNTAVYNGMPQTFEVTVNGEASTFNTDFVVPGEYPSGYTVYGVYDQTIGINPIMLFIDKAPCVYDVELPFPRIEYDGEAHAATVTVPEGSGDVTIIYENAVGERTTEAPTEVGVYNVYIIITEGEYYYGIPETYVGQFEIYSPEVSVNELTVGTNDNGAWYTIDGRRVAAPTERGIYIHNGKKYIVK